MSRKYKCLYCDKRYERDKLVNHISRVHPEMIPEGFTASRLVFNSINHTTGAFCRICKEPTEWNEKAGRYNVLCGKQSCKDKMREEYKKNMLRVKGTYNILNDPEQQKLMLSHRKISGEYQFSDGGKVSYTGTYEKNCLEFMDVVMNIKSEEIMSPGPTMEYIYNGDKHYYIPDFYYIPYNLIIEVKDGGDNPNNKTSKSMDSSREKTIEKERLITDRGEYNYVRLTNNNFAQLINVFMDIKAHILDHNGNPIIHINEACKDIGIDKPIKEWATINGNINNQYNNDSSINYNLSNKIKSINTEMIRDWKYGTIINGKEYTDLSKVNWNNYRTLSIDSLKANKIGICWDYVNYEHYILDELNVKHDCYLAIMQMGDKPTDILTHTFVIYYIDSNPIWFEASWKSNEGLHNCVKDRPYKTVIEALKKSYEYNTIAIYRYKPDGLDKNLNSNQFLKKASFKLVYAEENIYESANILENTLKGMDLYRVTVDGIGIYEAFKNRVDFNIWKRFLSSPDVNWLNKPSVVYKDGMKSYFTDAGYYRFKNETLPLISKFIPNKEIDVEHIYGIPEDNRLVYKDKYQVVIKHKNGIRY